MLVNSAAGGEAQAPRLSDLISAFENRRALVGIVGLGYVGMPLAITAAKAGFRVLGFDINEPRVEQINRGESFITYIPAQLLSDAVNDGRLEATADFARLDEPDAILICVPTSLTRHREPDLSYVADTTRSIAARLRKGQLVVLESTTYPGTTEQVVRPILDATRLKSGRDFYLAYSPEREDPGNPDFRTARIPKVDGAD